MASAMAVERAAVQAALLDREVVANLQEANDALMVAETLKLAFRTDVEPILAMARHDKAAAIDPIATYRASGYRQKIVDHRPAKAAAGSPG
jgi:L-rhamnose isomerase/sugar isomerase